MNANHEHITAAYMQAYRGYDDIESYEADMVAGGAVGDLEDLMEAADPDEAVAVLSLLVGQCISDDELAYIGAGPVEDYIYRASSAQEIKVLYQACANNQNLLWAIGTAWYEPNQLPSDVSEAVKFYFGDAGPIDIS